MNTQLPVIYTTEEFAAELGIKPKSLRRSIARGSLPKPDGYLGRTPYWSYNTVGITLGKRQS